MSGDALMMVVKTLYGVGAYLLGAMAAIIWFGIAIGSDRNTFWLCVGVSAAGFAGLFTALAVLATGNPLFGQEINAWFLRTFGWIGGVFLLVATYVYLFGKWRGRP